MGIIKKFNDWICDGIDRVDTIVPKFGTEKSKIKVDIEDVRYFFQDIEDEYKFFVKIRESKKLTVDGIAKLMKFEVSIGIPSEDEEPTFKYENSKNIPCTIINSLEEPLDRCLESFNVDVFLHIMASDGSYFGLRYPFNGKLPNPETVLNDFNKKYQEGYRYETSVNVSTLVIELY